MATWFKFLMLFLTLILQLSSTPPAGARAVKPMPMRVAREALQTQFEREMKNAAYYGTTNGLPARVSPEGPDPHHHHFLHS